MQDWNSQIKHYLTPDPNGNNNVMLHLGTSVYLEADHF